MPAAGLLVAAAFALAGFVAVVYGLGADNRLASAYDFSETFVYQKALLVEAFRAWRLPLWNPHVFSGMPLLANPQAQVLYPTSLLYLALAPEQAALVELLLHLALAGAGTFLLARRALGVSVEPACLAALAFPLSGFFVGHAFAGHLQLIMAASYIPLLAYLVDRGVSTRLTAAPVPRGGDWRLASAANAIARWGAWPWLAALALALQILAGGLQMVWLGLWFIGLWRLFGALAGPDRSGLRWRVEATVLGGMVTLGVALAAVQVLLTAELAALSNRPVHDFGYVARGSFAPAYLPSLLWPRAKLEPGLPWWEFYAYPGAITLLLAIGGAWLAVRNRRLWPWLLTAAVTFLFMLGEHGFLLRPLFELVPTFDRFRVPARAVLLFGLVAALLAALALDRWAMRMAASARWARFAPALVPALALATWLDLAGAARWQAPQLFLPGGEVATAVSRDALQAMDEDDGWYRFWAWPGVAPPNLAYAAQASSVGGYDGLMLRRYQRFIGSMTGWGDERLGLTRLNPRMLANAPGPFPFKILGVKYFLTPEGLIERDAAEPPRRAWFVERVRVMPDEGAALDYISGPAFEPFAEIVVEPSAGVAGTPGRPPTRQIDVRATERYPESLDLALGAHPAGVLVVSGVYYPGWVAESAGRRLPVFRCNVILRCLRLEGSRQPLTVRLSFRPESLRRGALVSVLAAATLLGGLLLAGLGSGAIRRREGAGATAQRSG